MYIAQVPINNALVLGNLSDAIKYIAKLDSLGYISVAESIGVSSTTFT